jgi:transposase
MRGRQKAQPHLFFTIDVESRIRADHPLRNVKRRVDLILAGMSDLFTQAYSKNGRPGIPPEQLLKALLLQALYSIRSEAQLVERIDTDLLFRWFLDLDPADDVFDATACAHNRPRRNGFWIIETFFDTIVQ